MAVLDRAVPALQRQAPDLAAAPGTPALVEAGAVTAKWKEPVLPLAQWLALAQSWAKAQRLATAKATPTEVVSDSKVKVPGHLSLAEIPDEWNEAVQHGAGQAGLHRDQNLGPLE
jgi:hypothetical protein